MLKHIVTLEALKSRRIKDAAYNRNQEFISFLACICIDSSKILPRLIYQGELGNL